jgi:hypothetical protein
MRNTRWWYQICVVVCVAAWLITCGEPPETPRIPDITKPRIYPGATVVVDQRVDGGREIIYESIVRCHDIVTWYDEQLPQDGWTRFLDLRPTKLGYSARTQYATTAYILHVTFKSQDAAVRCQVIYFQFEQGEA